MAATSSEKKESRAPKPISSGFPTLNIQQPHGIEKNDFQINAGRAIDRLRSDYPRLLRDEPDLTIFDPRLELKHTESDRILKGLDNYQRVFYALRLLRNS